MQKLGVKQNTNDGEDTCKEISSFCFTHTRARAQDNYCSISIGFYDTKIRQNICLYDTQFLEFLRYTQPYIKN